MHPVWDIKFSVKCKHLIKKVKENNSRRLKMRGQWGIVEGLGLV